MPCVIGQASMEGIHCCYKSGHDSPSVVWI